MSSGEYAVETDDDSNTVELFFGDDDDRDLIAKIQFSSLGSGGIFGGDDDDDDSKTIRRGQTVGIFRRV